VSAPPVLTERDGARLGGTSDRQRSTTLGDVERQCLDAITGRWASVMDVAAEIGNPNLRTYVASMRSKGVPIESRWREYRDARGRLRRVREYAISGEARERALGGRA
jgi:hypothetical protein